MQALRVFLGVLVVGLCVADLPNHCLWEQVHGDWTFHMSSAGHSKGVKCSEGKRDFGSGNSNFGLGDPNYEVARKLRVRLSKPNLATMRDSDGNVVKGTWTMIYDEGAHQFTAPTHRCLLRIRSAD